MSTAFALIGFSEVGATIPYQMKEALAGILKAVAGIAGVVFLLAPVTGMGILVCVVALFVAIIAGVIGSHLSDDDEDNNSGYWPKDPNSSASS